MFAMNKNRSFIDYKNPALRPITGEIIDKTWEIFAEHGIETLYSQVISLEDAEYINQKLVEAEQIAKHQGKESALKRVEVEDIIKRASNGHILLKNKADHNRIVGCIFLYKYDQRYQWAEAYERVTLWKDSAFWNQYGKQFGETASDQKPLAMGKYLMWKITREVWHKPLLSVTDNPVVVNNNIEMGYHILARKHLPPQLKILLSEYKELSEKKYSDKFFCLNDLFYQLVCNEIKDLHGEDKFTGMEEWKDSEIMAALKKAEIKAKKDADAQIVNSTENSKDQLSKVL